jgi:hypothetical protein
MRQVNDPRSPVAAAAGGCVLLQTAALERIGGFSAIKDRIIDDVSLARQIKRVDSPIRLTLSRSEVTSQRVYDSVAAIWVMVRRTAFTELRYSWLRLAGTLIGMTLMFVTPPLLVVSGLGMTWAGVISATGVSSPGAVLLATEGFSVWVVMVLVYHPAVHFFELSTGRCWTLPVAGVLYGLMTLDSAVRHITGLQIGWRDR